MKARAIPLLSKGGPKPIFGMVLPFVALALFWRTIAEGAPESTPIVSSAAGASAGAPTASSSAGPVTATPPVLWKESFAAQLDWRDPQEHRAAVVGRVYSVQREGPNAFLHARHDVTAKGAPPAVHFGKVFDGIPLTRVRLLRWRWRARAQPAIHDDPWEDMAASIYVVTRAPTLLRKGRGFKFGWLAKPGPAQTYQRGLLQVPQRSDPASGQWQAEEVDLCSLYRRTFGPCEDAQIIYIGVLTDADGVKSIAEGDYADFELVGTG